MKGRGRITRWVSKKVASRNKSSFIKKFDINWYKNINENVNFEIASFSGENQMADQLFSILSFYKSLGLPIKWTVFSDGSHTERSKKILREIPNVFFAEMDENVVPDNYKTESNPLLKKIFFYKTLPVISTTLLVDSDVLFFPNFKKFLPHLGFHNWFLVDENYGYLDKSYLDRVEFDIYPCNSGLLIFNSMPNWSIVLEYLDTQKKHTDGIMNWSEQTAFHVLTRDFISNMPLDPRYFIVGGSDSFKYSSDYNYDKIAVRHFVGPIRHKMWQFDFNYFNLSV
jgi:hypothetical protein